MQKTVHSGGAEGSDSIFSNIFVEYNYRVIHHSFEGHNPKSTTGEILIHSKTELDGNKEFLIEICAQLKRKYPTHDYIEKLLLRNIFQIKEAELVVGVGQISNSKNCIVNGGTGYGIMQAKLKNIPIIILNQSENKWYYSVDGEEFKKLNRRPKVFNFPNIFAAIGTRKLSDEAIKELRACFVKRSV